MGGRVAAENCILSTEFAGSCAGVRKKIPQATTRHISYWNTCCTLYVVYLLQTKRMSV